MPLRNLVAGLRRLFYKERVERELDQEVHAYLEASAAAKMRAGMDREQALRAARLEFGSVEGVKENVREVGWEREVESVWHDVRYAARLLRKDVGYTATAIAALAIGIGANTALFTLFAAVALKPLPVPHPEDVVSLWRTTPEHPRTGAFSFADYRYYQTHAAVFAGLAAESPSGLRLSGLGSYASGNSNGAEAVTVLFVTADYLSVFGVSPIAGRDFFPEEDQRAAGPYPVLLSENYWERRFSRDPGTIGRNLTLSGIAATVIGVTPRNFMGTRPEVPDIWIIMSARGDPQRREIDRATLCCGLTARLKPGATLTQAQAELSVLAASLRREYPQTEREWNVLALTATPFGPNHGNILKMFVVLQVAMGLVLLIACTNVAGLLLGKTAARQREISVRLALGASRSRLVRQLLTEGVCIAVAAGCMALLFTWQALVWIDRVVSTRLAAQGDTIAINMTPDVRVLLYALSISILAGVSFALAPALQSSRTDLVAALKEERTMFGVRRKSRLHAALVTAQIAVCLALLIGAGLLTSSSARLLSVDPGFETRTVLNVTLSSPQSLGYSTARQRELQTRLNERLRALPGVVSVSSASRAPLGGNAPSTRVAPQTEAAASPNEQRQQFLYSYVSKEYFQTLGIRLLRGRTFTAAEVDANAPVAMVSNSLARRFWPEGDAVGKRLAIGSPTEVHEAGRRAPLWPSAEIIGIAPDIYSVDLTAPDRGAVYLPELRDEWNSLVLVRIAGNPDVSSGSLVREVRAMEPGLAVSVETLRDTMASSGISVVFRVSSMIFGAIGFLGLVLASVGVYSLVAYSVSQKTHEVGIRMALGAQPTDVVRLILRGSAKSIATGLLLGAGLGVLFSLVLSSRLFLQGARLIDPLVILGVSLLTGGFAILASYVPARRVTTLNPATTLRFE